MLTRLLLSLVDFILSLFNLCLLIYVILSWVRPAANRFTELINRIVEPVLTPVRNFLRLHGPSSWSISGVDFSPVVLWILIGLVRVSLYWIL